MASYREILTKAIIGKGKKTTTDKYEVSINNIDNVLGCWVINHSFNGKIINDKVNVFGEYDVNIWYSYDNNTKTNVVIKKLSYNDFMSVNLKENASLNNNSKIIVKVLNQPNVIDVKVDNGIAKLEISKQLGIEVVGDMLMKVACEDDLNDYEEIIDDEINENYL